MHAFGFQLGPGGGLGLGVEVFVWFLVWFKFKRLFCCSLGVRRGPGFRV